MIFFTLSPNWSPATKLRESIMLRRYSYFVPSKKNKIRYFGDDGAPTDCWAMEDRGIVDGFCPAFGWFSPASLIGRGPISLISTVSEKATMPMNRRKTFFILLGTVFLCYNTVSEMTCVRIKLIFVYDSDICDFILKDVIWISEALKNNKVLPND